MNRYLLFVFSLWIAVSVLAAAEPERIVVERGDRKDVFYQSIRKKPGDMDTGDLSKMLDIKKRLQVRPFQWYIDNLDPGLGGVMKWRNKWPNSNIAISRL